MSSENSDVRSYDSDSYVYMDAAATSWPKPEVVVNAITGAMTTPIGNPGRSGHAMAINAGRLVHEARETISELFAISDPSRLVFTKNSTEALNLGLFGYLQPGDHVITTSMEHNSVMRPLRHLEKNGVEITPISCSSDGSLDPSKIRASIRSNTKLVVLTHASNVNGVIMPVADIAQICRDAAIAIMVDASQTAGTMPISVSDPEIDMLAFPGHKGMLGPTGTGGLYIRDGLELNPLMHGGTGSLSDEELQPNFLPDAYESGTLNVVGIAGLGAGARFLIETGPEKVRNHEIVLGEQLLDGLAGIPRLTVNGVANAQQIGGSVSVTHESLSPSEIGRMLDSEFNVMTRVGLHCAPIAHRTLGTLPVGSVRISWGFFNSVDDVDQTLIGLGQIVRRANNAGEV